ncbi:MAG: hypothetical protein Q8O25_10660 [Sulfurisoma sp.]|nr:hypothetical protein [Sulfurisoma sp.]
MQAIEFESIVQDQAIRLPASGALSSGQPVRVVVMFEEPPVIGAQQPRDDAISRPATHAVTFSAERIAALEPHPNALGGATEDRVPSPWDETAWREKWGRA